MADSLFQLPADGAGKKIRTRTRTQGVDTVHEQYVAMAGLPSWWVWTGAVVPAANKYHLAMLNAVGSGQVIKVRKLFPINTYVGAAVTGIALNFELRKISAIVGGTAVAPNIVDSTDTALTNFTCVHTPTSCVDGALLNNYYTNSDERVLTDLAVKSIFEQDMNLMMESPELKELALNPGEGFAVKQVAAGTHVGSYGFLAAITKE